MSSETHGRFKRWFWRPPRAHGEVIADRQVSFLELLYDLRTVVSGSSGCTSLAVYSPNASPLSRTRTCWPTARPIVASRAASTERCSRRSCRSRW
jgi:hypothetical protein